MRSTIPLALTLACTLEGSLGRDGDATGTGTDTRVPEACELLDGEDDCSECLKRRCCDGLATCVAQGSCQCIADCVQRGTEEASCRDACGADGEAAWVAFDDCAADMCTGRCP
jgi:hypothetical protein